jgi:hypothetical protein
MGRLVDDSKEISYRAHDVHSPQPEEL